MMEREKTSPERIEEILKTLTVDIGVRLAGSPGEKAAVAYVKKQLEATGAETAVESFPVRQREVAEEKLEISFGGEWRSFPCSLFSSTPGTGGEWIEAPVCFFASRTDYQREDLSHLRGKAVVHLGSHIESRDQYRRLMEAKPAFLMVVDIRYPGDVPLADGMFPSYTAAIGAVPTVNVAYQDAWRWKVEGVRSARVCVKGGMKKSRSSNVIASLPGREESSGVVFVGGHHDTQADSPGADDNATGTAAVIELTRLLAKAAPFRRGIRLISFGTEEQLSVGSAAYVRQHRHELAQHGRFMLNFDSFGSHLGWFELTANGPAEFTSFLGGFYRERDLFMDLLTDTMPYADHFPFTAAGIPSAYIGRSNCHSGRFFHHRPDDDMTRVSTPLVAEVINVSADLLAELADADPLPFPAAIPQEQAAGIDGMWRDLFGGWDGT